jgi:hypothetical protein
MRAFLTEILRFPGRSTGGADRDRELETPHGVFLQTLAATGDRIAAIRTIHERFGLDPRQAKEVMLQAEGTVNSLDEHEERVAIQIGQFLANRNPQEL